MAARDIMPWISPRGGTHEVRWGTMNASETFEVGEPVGVNDDGEIFEFPVDNTEIIVGDPDGVVGGIAAYGPGASNIDPTTGAAFATSARIPYWPWGQGTLFITSNFYAVTTPSTRVTPLQTDVGENYMIVASTTAAIAGWGIQQEAGLSGVDVIASVNEVLDANYAPIRISGGTGVYLVFEILQPTLAAA